MKFIKILLIFSIIFILSVLFLDYFIKFSEINPVSINSFNKKYSRFFKADTKYSRFNEGFTINKVNHYSYLNNGYPKDKPLNITRIALLGDSYVESHQVFNRNYFGTIIENNINSEIKDKSFHYQVLNFGRSGYGLENMFAFYKTFVQEFKPDYVLFFISIDDYYSKTSDPLSPHITFNKTNDFVYNESFSKSAVKVYRYSHKFIQKSPLLSMLNNCRKLAKSGKSTKIFFDKFATQPDEQIVSKDIKNKSYISDKNLLILKQMSKDSKIIIVNRSDEPYPTELKKLILEKNFNYIDLSEVIKNIKNQNKDPHFWKATNKRGHWNNSAHKSIGDYIGKKILQKIVK